MLRGIVLLAAIFSLILAPSVLAAEPGVGKIEGSLTNHTAGGGSVADIEITLKTFVNDNETDSKTTKSDAQGRFTFDGLSTKAEHSYQVTLTNQEAEYNSDRLAFDQDETTRSIEMIVYDSTTSDAAVRVQKAHTVVYVGENSLEVIEFLLFGNDSDRTYIGLTEGEKKRTLKFSLPRGATGLQYLLGLMECCIVNSEVGFADSMPLLPGPREVAYSYLLDYKSGAYKLSELVSYPTGNYSLLVQGDGVEVSSDQMTMGEPLDIQGNRFTHLFGENVPAGQSLTLRLSNLPQNATQQSLKWVIGSLIVLVGGFATIHLLRRRKLQPVSRDDDPGEMKQRLLFELAHLDNDFENGKIPQESYQKMRAARKARLVKLMGKPRGQRY